MDHIFQQTACQPKRTQRRFSRVSWADLEDSDQELESCKTNGLESQTASCSRSAKVVATAEEQVNEPSKVCWADLEDSDPDTNDRCHHVFQQKPDVKPEHTNHLSPQLRRQRNGTKAHKDSQDVQRSRVQL